MDSLSPAEDGFRFPAEWDSHAATWLTWPHNRETWPHNLTAAQEEFERFARTLAEVEPVNILATGELAETLQAKFRAVEKISICSIPTDDSWIRDYGPTFVKNQEQNLIRGIDWTYDGWGEKYPPFENDRNAAAKILESIDCPRVCSELILEGGAIESNGMIGLATKHCIQLRNPQLSLEQIEAKLQRATGLHTIHFLDCLPIPGDDTDSHIDQIARFVSANQIVASRRQRPLLHASLIDFHLDLIDLPDPAEVKLFGGILPASYTNFYFANEVIVVPQFDDPQDSTASALLQELLPDRTVIGLPSRNLLVGLGSFHCLSQQQPA